MIRLSLIAILTLAVACSSSRKPGGRVYDAVTVDNETLQLKNDTLYFSSGLKFFVGQKLIVGNPAGYDGYYRSIIYPNAALVPSIWGQNKNYDHAIENHVNVKKSREVVKQSLTPGKLLTITGIGLHKGSRPNFYMVGLAADAQALNCDIQFALSLKELSLPKP